MVQTIEAIIDEQGNIRLLGSVNLSTPHRAFVMILEESPSTIADETASLSEPSLAKDWTRPEEDKAWSYLQRPQSF